MKILQINNHHEVKGGSERVYLETGKLLAAHNHQVFYFSSAQPGKDISDSTHCIIDAKSFNKAGWISQLMNAGRFIYSSDVAARLDDFLSKVQPDIAHLHIFYGQLTNSILPVLKKHKIPCVMSVHEYRLLCPVYTLFDQQGKICDQCASGNYLPAITKRCNRNNILFSALSSLECFVRDRFFAYEKYISTFIMVSQFCKNIHDKHRPGMAAKSVKLFNFVDLDCFRRTETHDGYYLYLGRISHEKGIRTLLEAVQHTTYKLKVVGTGDLLACLEAEFVNYPNIEFCGFRSGAELAALIQGAKFLCIPSECNENNPMSVIESFAYGKPAIGSDIGGIPEMVINNETGFLFPPGDSNALRDLLQRCEQLTEDEYRSLCINAYEFVKQNNSKEVHYSNLMRIYDDVISSQCLTQVSALL